MTLDRRLGGPKHHPKCAVQMDADHIVTEPNTLHRVSVDAVSYWMTDHSQECTAIHEQRAGPPPRHNAWEYSIGIHECVPQPQDRGARGAHPPIILGTDGAIHEKTRRHLEERGRHPGSRCGISVVEHQHHKAILKYMARVNCSEARLL